MYNTLPENRDSLLFQRWQASAFLLVTCICVVDHCLITKVEAAGTLLSILAYTFVLLASFGVVLSHTSLAFMTRFAFFKVWPPLVQSHKHWLHFSVMLVLFTIATPVTLPALLTLGFLLGGHWASRLVHQATSRPITEVDTEPTPTPKPASDKVDPRVASVASEPVMMKLVWCWWATLTMLTLCYVLALPPFAVLLNASLSPTVPSALSPLWLKALVWAGVLCYGLVGLGQHQHLLKHVLSESKALEALSLTDPLTGLMNRRRLNDLLSAEMARSHRHATPCCVVLFDIDHFKHINDTYGHHCGDDVLQQLAQLIKSNLRPYDALARYGGEEFAVILPNTQYQAAGLLMERLRLLVASTVFRPAGFSLKITISVGVTQLATQHQTTLALLDEADSALYAAKNLGRNQTHVFGVGRLQPSSNQRILNSVLVD